MSKPIAVISGDIHYSIKNLDLADIVTRMAIEKANYLNVPFIANGDTSDTKAILRAECINAMIETFKIAKIHPYINIGNHCKINTKGIEHSLNFLKPYAEIIEYPKYIEEVGSWVIPYYDNKEELLSILEKIPKNSRLIMHQGVLGSSMGDYIKDNSAIHKTALSSFRTILSHYHGRQDIQCSKSNIGLIGTASYIGAPYTMSYGEANDPEKGFQILMDDGTLEFVPTNLRKHIVIDVTTDSKMFYYPNKRIKSEDLVWVKVKGTKEDLAGLDKNKVRRNLEALDLPENFKLELIPLNTETQSGQIGQQSGQKMSQLEVLDNLIESLTNTSDECKIRLKSFWKEL